jgi:hypothetical protein
MRATPLLSALAFALATCAAHAATLDYSLSVEERLLGDSNILRLSDVDRDRLDQDPSFETDVNGDAALKLEQRLNARVSLRYRPKAGFLKWLQTPFGTRSAKLDLSAALKGSHYEGSSAKGYGSYRLRLTWTPRPGWGLDVSSRLLDNFYLQQFRDRDTGQTVGAEFDALENTLSLRMRMKDAWLFARPSLKLTWLRERSSYNAWFTEYDTDAWGLVAQIAARLPKGFDASLSYQFTQTDNVGFSPAAFLGGGGDDEGGDASHEEDSYKLNLGYATKVHAHPLSIDVDLGFRDRYYQSDLGVWMDPVHYARHDRRYFFGLRATLKFTKHLHFIPLFEREWRVTEGADALLPDVKDFEVWRAGLGVKWKLF